MLALRLYLHRWKARNATIRTRAVATPSHTAKTVQWGPRRWLASKVTPAPATMLLMKAIMLAAVVMKASSAPNRSGGEAPSGQRPLSAEK